MASKYYRVEFDPTYSFPLGVRFPFMQVDDGLNRGTWPVGLVFKNMWTGQYMKVTQHLSTVADTKTKGEMSIRAMRTAAGKNPDVQEVRYEYYFWSIDQLIDEILRLGKLKDLS